MKWMVFYSAPVWLSLASAKQRISGSIEKRNGSSAKIMSAASAMAKYQQRNNHQPMAKIMAWRRNQSAMASAKNGAIWRKAAKSMA
jgi:hypothetical protein